MLDKLNLSLHLIAVSILVISGCKTSEPNGKEELALLGKSIQGSSEELIRRVPNDGVEFQCELGEIAKFGEHFSIDIECLVINNTDQEIHYLNQTCNQLEYYLVLVPETYEVMPWLCCNATYALISVLSPRDSVKFKTRIFVPNDSKHLEKIGLDFRVVDRFVPLDTLMDYPEMVESIYRAKTADEDIIWNSKK